jgi:hypothetical protein
MQTSTKTIAELSNTTSRGPRFANWVLIACLLFSAAWLLYAIASHKSHLYQKLVPSLAVIFCLLALRSRASVRTVVALVIVGVWGGLYAAELALNLIDPAAGRRNEIRKVAQRAGTPFDGRTRLQVVTDLRKKGVLAYPTFYPYLLFDSPPLIDGIPTLPLSSVSNAVTVSCNEGGQYLIFTTDERGFPNPSGIWPKGRADIAITGDSIAVGECIPPRRNIGSQLRERYPETISLGSGGNGPLVELGTLKEYLPSLKPKRVLWFFYEGNDMDDLEQEKRSRILMHYLDSDFSQGLLQKEQDVSRAVAGFLDGSLKKEQSVKKTNFTEEVAGFILLNKVRLSIWRFMDTEFAQDRPRGDFALLERVLREAQRTVNVWDGQFTIVYLPAPFRYPDQALFSPHRRMLLDHFHREVLRLADRLRIRVLDLTGAFPDVRAPESRKNARFFYPYSAHYTPEGYRVVGRAILKGLSIETPVARNK